MTSNSAQIVHQVHHDFQALLDDVTGAEARAQTAYSVELMLFRRLLALGAGLLRLFFVSRAAERPTEPVTASDGTRLLYRDRRPISYYSVFGKVQFERHYFIAPGQVGVCPLDAALSLPARCYSDLLCDWASHTTTDAAYRESQTALERILGLRLSVQALESVVAEAAADVSAFYEQPGAAAPSEGTILVVSADGKGVPMVEPPSASRSVRLGKGQKRTHKKEAVVTALYTIAPYERTPHDIVEALLSDERPAPSLPSQRPAPLEKEVHATLAGKGAALTDLAQRAAPRAGPQIQHRVALTDGAEALQQQMQTHFPTHTLVLDIIHVTEYLWDAVNALLGETHPGRQLWVRRHLAQIVAGQTQAVLTALAQEIADPTYTDPQRQVVRRTLGYYQRNLPYMRYDEYLAHGWPIGTGVIEGACGHLVKDRMEQAGMRWTQDGAQAVLNLRAVRLNGHWDAYWQAHRAQQQRRLYGGQAYVSDSPEAQVLAQAA